MIEIMVSIIIVIQIIRILTNYNNNNNNKMIKIKRYMKGKKKINLDRQIRTMINYN